MWTICVTLSAVTMACYFGWVAHQIISLRLRRKLADAEIRILEDNLARTRDAYLSELEKFGKSLELERKIDSKLGVN